MRGVDGRVDEWVFGGGVVVLGGRGMISWGKRGGKLEAGGGDVT